MEKFLKISLHPYLAFRWKEVAAANKIYVDKCFAETFMCLWLEVVAQACFIASKILQKFGFVTPCSSDMPEKYEKSHKN